MKLKLVVTPLLLLFVACSVKDQDAKTILQKSLAACQSVENGYYEMVHRMKYMSEKDTATTSFHCSFKRTTGDTIFPVVFHYKILEGDTNYVGEILYNGDDLVTAFTHDSVATIISKKLWPGDLVNYRMSFEFYTPFIYHKLSPFRKEVDLGDSAYTFRFIGDEQLKEVPVYHVQVNEAPQQESPEEKHLRSEYHYWIRKSDFIPVQYSIAYDMVMNNDTMYQHGIVTLDKSVLNELKEEREFNMASLPSFYKAKSYMPFEEPKPLPLDTVAPGWELLSIKDQKVSLSSLKGKLVLADFFYKSCYPCMQALPVLQALSETYKSKGLEVIGIDPNDTKQDGIAEFLAKRGVTYTVLLGGEKTAEHYRVYGYPTLFLISKTGKIIFTAIGYGPDTEARLEELIKKNL